MEAIALVTLLMNNDQSKPLSCSPVFQKEKTLTNSLTTQRKNGDLMKTPMKLARNAVMVVATLYLVGSRIRLRQDLGGCWC